MEKKNSNLNIRKKRNTSKPMSAIKGSEIHIECEKLFRICSDPSYTNHLWENYLEISNILNNIKNLENRKKQTLSRSDVIDEFINWMKQNGAKISGISIHNFPGYDLGLRAEKDIKENNMILQIPSNLIFNVNTAGLDLKDIRTDALIQHMPQVALAIALLLEKHKHDSKWKHYLNILPKEYSTVLYMSPSDLLELKGGPSLECALKQCRTIARQYAYFKRLFRSTENSVSNLLRDIFTYEEYRWAVSTVMTRQNIIPSEDKLLMIHSLIPMWDMCNHEEGKITTDFNESSNCCECYAMRNFKIGDQIFIYYGPRSNTEFFVHSGFIYPDNRNDSFKLRLGVSKSDPLYKERVELLSKVGLPPVSEYLLNIGPKPISDLLLTFLRIFNMSKDELDHWLKSDVVNYITKKDCLIKETTEKNALQFIKTRIKLLLSSYPTPEQDDLELLKTSQQFKKLAIQMRLSEKNILRNVLKAIESQIKI